jgi:hypothetical protein
MGPLNSFGEKTWSAFVLRQQQNLVQAVKAQSDPVEAAKVLQEQLLDIASTQGEDAAHAALAEFIEADPKKAAEVIAELYGSRGLLPEDDDAAVDALLQGGVREAMGSLNAAEREDFARALAEGTAVNNLSGQALQGITRLVMESGSEAFKADYVEQGLRLVNERSAGGSYTQAGNHWVDFVSTLGFVAADSPAAAQAAFNVAKKEGLGSAAPGEEGVRELFQAFAIDNPIVGSPLNPHPDEAPYTRVLGQLMSSPYISGVPAAALGRLSADDALLVFKAIAGDQSGSLDVSLLEADQAEGDNRGTQLASELFMRYMPQWIDSGAVSVDSGYIRSDMVKPLDNFLRSALFDPNEDNPARDALYGVTARLLVDLGEGRSGGALSEEARGRLMGALSTTVNDSFDNYVNASGARGELAVVNFIIDQVAGVAGGALTLTGPAKLLAGVALNGGKEGVKAIAADLVERGIEETKAQAAAELAVNGDLAGAFKAIGLTGPQWQQTAELIQDRSAAIASGDYTFGELLQSVASIAFPDQTANIAEGRRETTDMLD